MGLGKNSIFTFECMFLVDYTFIAYCKNKTWWNNVDQNKVDQNKVNQNIFD